MTAAARHDDLTFETIRSALLSIDANLSRQEWARVGMALKSELGDSGFSLFDEWSRTDREGYNERAAKETWKSINPGGGVNIGTLIYRAQQAGWTFDDDAPRLDAAQVAARQPEREAERKAADAAKRKAQGDAAKLANLTWEAAEPAGDQHPYLLAKRVRAHGLGLGGWPVVDDNGAVVKTLSGALLLPIMDAKNGKIISLQGYLLDMDGAVQKRYLRHARKSGGCHMIGTPPAAGGIVVFCEGYATGATIHELTGWCVVVAFDAPNLPVVAELMREQMTQAAFVIAADNDQWSKLGDIQNPGLHYAQRAAANTRACVVAPQFTDLTGEPTDWNDLAVREGGDVARAQLMAVPVAGVVGPKTDVAPAVGPVNDNVDYFTPLPFVGGKGKPLATIENLAEIMNRLGVTVRYNMIAKTSEVLIPGETNLSDNRAGASLARVKSECAKFGMSTETLGDFLLYLSDKNAFNPVAEWITSKPWDGVSRFSELLATIQAANRFPRSLLEMLVRRWLISAVAAAVKPSGFWSKGVLVFQGDQSLGKTSWFRALVPDELRELIKVDAAIDPANKDTIISAVSHWLVELGELDGTLRKADIARLKGFISQDIDEFRRPYARIEERFPRRTAFFASVNPEAYLGDDTGNVRWWTIPVRELDLELLAAIDKQQLWAEVLAWFEGGERWWLVPQEEALLEASNIDHQQADPVEELIQAKYGAEDDRASRAAMTATQVLLAIGYDRPTKAQLNTASIYLRKLFGPSRKSRAGRVFNLPDVTNGYHNDAPF